MSDDFLNALLSTGPKEEDIRRKIHDELRDMSFVFAEKGRSQMAAGLTLASMVALGMKIDTDGHRIFDELLDLNNTETAWDREFSFESKPIKDIDAMGREKFWEDLGRPDGS